MTQLTEDNKKRVKQIRGRRNRNTGPNFGYVQDLCEDIDFLLSLYEQQLAENERLNAIVSAYENQDEEALAQEVYDDAIDSALRTPAAATPAPVEQQTFRNTKEAMLYAQRNNIPAVVPVSAPSSTQARAAAEEIVKAWLWHSHEHDQERARTSIQGIIEKHCGNHQ